MNVLVTWTCADHCGTIEALLADPARTVTAIHVAWDVSRWACEVCSPHPQDGDPCGHVTAALLAVGEVLAAERGAVVSGDEYLLARAEAEPWAWDHDPVIRRARIASLEAQLAAEGGHVPPGGGRLAA
jgi:hypothetical protein